MSMTTSSRSNEGNRGVVSRDRPTRSSRTSNWLTTPDSFIDDFFDASRGMNRLFNRFRDDLEPTLWDRDLSMTMPNAEVIDNEKSVDVKLDVPGFKKENINIRLEDSNTLVVEGSRDKDVTKETSTYTLSERAYGKFERRFTLPRTIDENSINAKLNEGVLSINLQKVDRPKKTIEIG